MNTFGESHIGLTEILLFWQTKQTKVFSVFYKNIKLSFLHSKIPHLLKFYAGKTRVTTFKKYLLCE